MNELANGIRNIIEERFSLDDIDIYLSSIIHESEIQDDCVIIHIPEIKLESLRVTEGVKKNGKKHTIRGVYLKYEILTSKCFFMRRVFSKEEIQANYIHSHVPVSKFSFNWIEYKSGNLCFGDAPFSNSIGSIGEKVLNFYNHVLLMFSHEHNERIDSYPKIRHIEKVSSSVFLSNSKTEFSSYWIHDFLKLEELNYKVDHNILERFNFTLKESQIQSILYKYNTFDNNKVILYGGKYYNNIDEIKMSSYNLDRYNYFKFKGVEVEVQVINYDISGEDITYVFHSNFITSCKETIEKYINERAKEFNKNFSEKIIREFTTTIDG